MSHHQPDEQAQPQQPTKEEPQPTPGGQPAEYEDPVDEAVDDSFPASDPPSWGGSTATLEPEAE